MSGIAGVALASARKRHESAPHRAILAEESRVPRNRMPRNDLKGNLELLILKTLEQQGRLHGYGIVVHIKRASKELLHVEEGSLYPALVRMERSRWIASDWSLTGTNRRAKYYRLTGRGGKELRRAEKDFEQLVKGMRAMFESEDHRS